MTTASTWEPATIHTSTSTLDLDVAVWSDLARTLAENYKIWSGGLSREKYSQWIWSQLQQPWARKNCRYLVAKQNNEVVSSCKLYIMDFMARGRHYRVGGVGAVFTPERFRGNGYATQMLEKITKRCTQDGFDALLLYSDIDTGFYEQLGYEVLSNCDFHIWIKEPAVERWIMSDTSFAQDMHEHAPDVALAEVSDAPAMVAHYQRFLPSKNYGAYRTDAYWQFKLQREKFRHNNSLTWPALEMMSIELGTPQGGYAIFEHAGLILRVIEVVGSEATVELLWRHLLRTALLRRVQLVRGWEAAAPEFVKGIKYAERDWATPMLLSINKETEKWLDIEPCQLFELDHF